MMTLKNMMICRWLSDCQGRNDDDFYCCRGGEDCAEPLSVCDKDNDIAGKWHQSSSKIRILNWLTHICATRTMLLLGGVWWRQFWYWKLGCKDDVLSRQDDQDQEHLTLFSFRRSWGSMYICVVGLAHHRGHLALYSCVGNISIFNLTIIAHCCLHFHSFLQPESYIFLNSSPLRLCLPADIFFFI